MKEFYLKSQMQSTICDHRDNGRAGGVFKSYNIIRVSGISCHELCWVSLTIPNN